MTDDESASAYVLGTLDFTAREACGMRSIEDAYPFMRMMTFECGFRAVGVPYKWVERRRGISSNSLVRLVDQGMNGLVTFTAAPLRLVLFSGFLIATLAILYAIFNLVMGVVYYRELAPPGTLTIITALFFFAGVQLFSIGILAEYILAIYAQVRRKPIIFERERINFSDDDPPAATPRVLAPYLRTERRQ